MKWRATTVQLKGKSLFPCRTVTTASLTVFHAFLPLGLRTLRAPPSSTACSSTNVKPADFSLVLLSLTHTDNRILCLASESEECDKESSINKGKTLITGTRCVLLSEVIQ